MALFLARSLIKLIVTVAILGVIYLFAIKPILDTTNNAFDQFGGLSNVAEDIQGSFDDAGIDSFDIESLGDKISDTNLQRFQKCVDRAAQDTDKLAACAKRFQK